jgi:hypothetical protein
MTEPTRGKIVSTNAWEGHPGGWCGGQTIDLGPGLFLQDRTEYICKCCDGTQIKVERSYDCFDKCYDAYHEAQTQKLDPERVSLVLTSKTEHRELPSIQEKDLERFVEIKVLERDKPAGYEEKIDRIRQERISEAKEDQKKWQDKVEEHGTGIFDKVADKEYLGAAREWQKWNEARDKVQEAYNRQGPTYDHVPPGGFKGITDRIDNYLPPKEASETSSDNKAANDTSSGCEVM